MPDISIKLLENAINYCSVKNKVIAKNISNVGTENYRREDVVFKDFLTGIPELKTTSPAHIGKNGEQTDNNYEVVYDKSREMSSGVNNVDIDKEMSSLAENSLQFRFLSRKIGDYYKTLQKVIKGDAQ